MLEERDRYFTYVADRKWRIRRHVKLPFSSCQDTGAMDGELASGRRSRWGA